MSEEAEPIYSIEQESYRVYRVVNNKSGKVYRVWKKENDKYTCTCPLFEFGEGRKACKHILMILKLEGKIV